MRLPAAISPTALARWCRRAAPRSRAILLLLATVPMMAGCSDGCRNTVLARAASPDGRYAAVLFARDCDATSPVSTQITVVPAADRFGGSGNAFRADADHGAARTGEWGGPWAEMEWAGPVRLRVRYAARARIFESAGAVGTVRIDYEAVAP